MFTKTEIKNALKKLNICLAYELFKMDDIMAGIEIELEHGKRSKETNITNDNLIMTLKILLAHLREYPDYYIRLKKMEKDAKKYWKNKWKFKKHIMRCDKNGQYYFIE